MAQYSDSTRLENEIDEDIHSTSAFSSVNLHTPGSEDKHPLTTSPQKANGYRSKGEYKLHAPPKKPKTKKKTADRIMFVPFIIIKKIRGRKYSNSRRLEK
jgi:hypothetical protein